MPTNLGSRCMLGELRCSDGEVEQEVDAKTCLRVEEVRASRPIEPKPDGRYCTIGDRRAHTSDFVQMCDELESTVIEETDRTRETVARMCDHEIEVAGHSA